MSKISTFVISAQGLSSLLTMKLQERIFATIPQKLPYDNNCLYIYIRQFWGHRRSLWGVVVNVLDKAQFILSYFYFLFYLFIPLFFKFIY